LKCNLDLGDPHFRIIGNAPDANLQSGLQELKQKVAKDHQLSGFFSQPMKKFPDYQGKIWKWDFAPAGEATSTRKGWRLFAFVPDPKAAEPILARAFVCYDKDHDPGGNPAKYLAGVLKDFLSQTIEVAVTEDRFRRQSMGDGKIVSLCLECYETLFSADDTEADGVEAAHECSGTPA